MSLLCESCGHAERSHASERVVEHPAKGWRVLSMYSLCRTCRRMWLKSNPGCTDDDGFARHQFTAREHAGK